MMYFIKSVCTISTDPDCRTTEVLQTVAKRFEHTMLDNEVALCSLVCKLDELITVCNYRYRDKTAELRHIPERSYIYASTGSAGEDLIFAISYVPVGKPLLPYQICNEFTDSLWDLDKEVFIDFCDEI